MCRPPQATAWSERSTSSGARTCSMAMIAAPITPARSPSRHGTILRSRVASGSDRLKIPSRTPARSCACASAMSPPITITAGLKKLTVPASTSPSVPACVPDHADRAEGDPPETRRTTSRLCGCVFAFPPPASVRAPGPLRSASRQPTFPQRQTTSSLLVQPGCGRCRRPRRRAPR